MIRAGVLVLALAVPAGAEGLAGQALCEAAWAKASAGLATVGDLTSTGVVQEGDWCVVESPVLDLQRQFVPDWHLDRLKVRGAALGWIVDGSTLPEGLEIVAEGLRLVVQTGNPRMDWLIAAQSRPNRIDAKAALAWNPAGRVLQLETLSLDFPGENLIEARATLTGVDLSSTGAAQMSATSFALTAFDAQITTHGLFEGYLLMALGPVVLPSEGDMDAAFAGMQAEAKAFVADLPGSSFPDATKAAVSALIEDLPNPAGELTVGLRAEPGIGPVRLAPWVMTGVPDTLAEAAGVLEGVTVDVGWNPGNAE
jgi:hypothetical protein